MESVILYQKKEDCCGCGICSLLCPVQAIFMYKDKDGFFYPKINTDVCIKCYKCVNGCAFRNCQDGKKPINAYAAVNKNKEQRFLSTSGGAFSAMATQHLKDKGYICGATMIISNKAVYVEHIIINNIKDLPKLQGSKYVQSSIVSILEPIKDLLLDGKKILFVGTPCQVIALNKFLGKRMDNLITVDIICHGVPSPKLFEDYIKYLEKKKNGSIIEFKFRDKIYGWGKYGSALLVREGQNKKLDIPCNKSSYYSFFMDGSLQRENCYCCPYAKKERYADITLGDYWGIEKFHAELLLENGGTLDMKKGISAVLANTQKGKTFILNCKDSLELVTTTVDNIVKGNSQLRYPTQKGKLRTIIYSLYTIKGGGYWIIDKLFLAFKLKNKIQKVLKRCIHLK